jgi:hypothetical protein
MPHAAWNKRLTPDIEHFIIDKYRSGLSANQILPSIPFRTRKTIYDVLERHGVLRRGGIADYKGYDEAVFAVIDSPAKAYWLGILISDGYVIDSAANHTPQIGLQMADREAVEGFRDFLNLKRSVIRLEPRNDRHQPMYRVTCCSRRMAKDLARLGVIPRKSLHTYLPILSEDLMPHLIRGIFDGDGTVSKRADGKIIVGFCGSERLVAEVRMWLLCRLGVSDNRVHENGAIRFVQWTHRSDVRRIAQYFYRDAEEYLERKFALLRECL